MQVCTAPAGTGGTSSVFNPLTIPWFVAWQAQDVTTKFGGGAIADGNVIASIPDASGNGNTGTVLDSGHSPTWRASSINGHPALDSSVGTQPRASITFGTAWSLPLTMVGVAKITSLAAYKAFMGNGVTANAFLLGTGASNAWRQYAGSTALTNGTAVANAPHLFVGEFAVVAANSTFTIDGVAVTGNPGTNASFDGFTVCAGANGSSNGIYHVAWAACINRVLTTLEKTNLHSWSQSFYGTP